jgi:uncharacterized membrane protein YbaN (DUF454 family)
MLYSKHAIRETAMLNKASWIVIGILVAAAAYELALALGAGSLGPQAGDNVPGAVAVRLVATLAIVVGAGLVLGSLSSQRASAALLAPAAACFVVPLYFTFDPYYAPTLRRYSDGGMFPPSWIVAVAAAAIVAGVLTWLVPRVGAPASALVLLALAFTALLIVGGH